MYQLITLVAIIIINRPLHKYIAEKYIIIINMFLYLIHSYLYVYCFSIDNLNGIEQCMYAIMFIAIVLMINKMSEKSKILVLYKAFMYVMAFFIVHTTIFMWDSSTFKFEGENIDSVLEIWINFIYYSISNMFYGCSSIIPSSTISRLAHGVQLSCTYIILGTKLLSQLKLSNKEDNQNEQSTNQH